MRLPADTAAAAVSPGIWNHGAALLNSILRLGVPARPALAVGRPPS